MTAKIEQVGLGAELLAEARRQEGALVGFLKELVLRESPSDVPESQRAVQDLLEKALADLGFRVRRIRGKTTGGHLYARPTGRRRGPYQLLLGHCDTVWPLGALATMPLVEEGGRLRGPGVFDMKAGLALMVFALRVLRSLGRPPKVAPIIFVNSDEEIGSPESSPWIRRLARAAARTFVLEPALGPEGKLKTRRKGVARFRIEVRGKAAHAGLDPENGVSAIEELARQILVLHGLTDLEQGITVNVGTIGGGTRPNVIASHAWAEVDVRTLSGRDADRVAACIQELEPTEAGAVLEVRSGLRIPPLEKTPRNRALWEAARESARELGLELEEATAGGGSDGNTTSRFTATLDGLGAVGGGAHASHEFVELSSLAERCALLARLLLLEP